MDNKRAFEIESGKSSLTDEEIKQGYHFCPDWDFMVVGPNDPEAESCTCKATRFD